MGGGLNFLNKKTWHPARPQNLEEVWKREQKAAAEAKKAEELRKQLEEERKRSEFVQMAMDTGHLRKEERLDWMYGSGLQAKQDAEKRREDMLTGKTEVALAPEQQVQETSRAEQVALLPSFYASATPASQNETWLRLNNDPLFAIKRQQQEQLSKLRENPIKMMELLKNLAKAKEKAEKKKEKKEKKEKRKRERDSDSNLSGEDGGVRAAKRSRSPPAPPPRYGAGSHERQVPPRGPHELEHGYHQPPAGPRGCSPSGRERHDRDRGRGYGEREQVYRHELERRNRMEYERKPQRGDERDYARRAEHHGRFDDRDNADWESRHEDRSGPGGAVRQDGREREVGRGRHEGDRRTQELDRERRRDCERKDDCDGCGERVQQQERGRKHGGEERRDVSGGGGDASLAREREERQLGDRYGLKHSSAAPEVLLQADNSNRAAETRAKLEEARRIREEEERVKAAQRYVRKDYKTGQITEEERQRRLAEMMGNAEEHEMERRRRLDAAAAADMADEESQRIVSQANAARGSDAFRDAAARDVYSKLQGSLEARVNSRRHFSAR